jgi:hypothetical protein
MFDSERSGNDYFAVLLKQNRLSRVFVSVSWNQGGQQEKDQKQLTNFLVFWGRINPKRRLRCDRLQQN